MQKKYTKYFDFPNAEKKETLYLDINELATKYSQSQCKDDNQFMSNYSYQLEELLLAHILTPYFNINFSYIYDEALLTRAGTMVLSTDYVKGVQVSIGVNLAYYNSHITEIEINSYYSRHGGESFWNKAEGILLGDKNIKESAAHQNSANEEVKKEVKDNYFYYNYSKMGNKNQLNHFFYHDEAYILTFIRFCTNGESYLPYMRNNEPTYLIYRHIITLEETSYKSKQLDYKKPQSRLDRVMIGSWKEGWKK